MGNDTKAQDGLTMGALLPFKGKCPCYLESLVGFSHEETGSQDKFTGDHYVK